MGYRYETLQNPLEEIKEKKLLDDCIARAKAGTLSGFISHEKLKKELGL